MTTKAFLFAVSPVRLGW